MSIAISIQKADSEQLPSILDIDEQSFTPVTMIKWLLVFLLPAQLCLTQAPSSSKTVYSAPITKGNKIGSEWKLKSTNDCQPIIAASPKGGRVFISKIPIGKQSLHLRDLPSHSHIRVQFDLILKGTWDGDHKEWGPDTWKFDIDGREALVHSSFCNNVAAKVQSFPDFHNDGYKVNPQFTKALESSTLGYIWNEANKNITVDSVYRFDFTVPHTKSSLQLNFESEFTDVAVEPNNEQWYGLDNIKISTLTNPQQESAKTIRSKIDALASSNANVRHQARLSLLASDVSFVDTLKTQLKQKKNSSIAKIIPLLNDESYQVRTDTTNKLLTMSAEHLTQIEQELNDATEPEIISRLRHIVNESRNGSSADYQTELARLLRIINTPQAKELLRTKSLKLK